MTSKEFIELTTKMTMTNEYSTQEPTAEFWLTHADPTQAAVHLALQWLAYVYPASELHIDRTLKQALPYADSDLSSRWSQFLDENDVEEHVDALEWLAQTLSVEQIPFLVETCWRLLLVDHELPTHVPLALRILARIIDIDETKVHDLGESIHREYNEEDESRNRAPLLPVDPRYLDRVEWRLYGHSVTQRLNYTHTTKPKERNYSSMYGFGWGSLFGAVIVIALVFGPLQLGRVKVPIMVHEGLLVEPDVNAVQSPVQAQPDIITPVAQAAGNVEATSVDVATNNASESQGTEIVPVDDVIPPVEPIVESPTEVTAPTVSIGQTERVLMEVSASILNVRKEAVVGAEVLIKLAGGARVWAYPEESVGLWMLVKVEGQTGYASARFLEEVETP